MHPTVRANQMHEIESYDCTSMKGMQINDCARAWLYPKYYSYGTKWNVNLFAFLIRNTWLHALGDTDPIPDPFSPRAWKGAGDETRWSSG